jgi:hypothetical protein
MPNMGMKRRRRNRGRQPATPGLADALFAKVQQRVLGVLFGNPGRSFYANEVIGLARSGTGAVQRELARLEGAGLVTATRVGKQKHYQANRASPVFQELRPLVLKTSGLGDVLREATAPLSSRIRAAFVYGSVAKGEDTATSDIDLLVIGEGLSPVRRAGRGLGPARTQDRADDLFPARAGQAHEARQCVCHACARATEAVADW